MTECLNDSKITLNVPTTILLKDMGLVARSKRACLEEFDNLTVVLRKRSGSANPVPKLSLPHFLYL